MTVQVSSEPPWAASRRLTDVLASAQLARLEGLYSFRIVEPSDRPASDAIALVRYGASWSQLAPASNASDPDNLVVFSVRFPDGVDNSGFVGWLAGRLKAELGTGVAVVCGFDPAVGGIYDYWGVPASAGDAVAEAIERWKTGSAAKPQVAPLVSHIDVHVKEPELVRPLWDAVMRELGCPPARARNGYAYSRRDTEGVRTEFVIIHADALAEPSRSRIAFSATSRAVVDRVAAILGDTGAVNVEGPRFFGEYDPSFYAVYFEDAFGNRLEVCHHQITR